eukprot:689764-Pleurochrysis_carterae.AAC.2
MTALRSAAAPNVCQYFLLRKSKTRWRRTVVAVADGQAGSDARFYSAAPAASTSSIQDGWSSRRSYGAKAGVIPVTYVDICYCRPESQWIYRGCQKQEAEETIHHVLSGGCEGIL